MDKNNQFGYHAWLQPRVIESLPGFTLSGLEGFAYDECKKGIARLTGGKPGNTNIELSISDTLTHEAYTITGSFDGISIAGGGESGLLYGVYGLLARLSQGQTQFDVTEKPATSRRILNHWDNIDGSVERGYSGKSLFFKDGQIAYDPERLHDYARLLASIGINQICINNVNVYFQSAQLITQKLPDVARIADIFRPFGIKLIISVHFESPALLGGLETSDPLDEDVANWWKQATAEVYKHIPDLAGFLIKADSEFRAGPMSLGRTQAEGANVIAKALKPFGGMAYWRCFVYNCMQDWRDTVTDRPKAAYNYFKPLDGDFDDNVMLQIKHGPSDFQVREPNSPLLGAMDNTRQGMELQVTQEYTGQQKDLYALAVQWEEIFEHPVTSTSKTRDLVGNKIEAVVAVANTGSDANWTGHLLAQANLYAFGKMAWDPTLTAAQVTKEWVALTFGTNPQLFDPMVDMILSSRAVYEKYNAPLGIGWMVNINHHYGPSVDGYEYMKWGTYHRADTKAIGVDRTSAGTGLTAQYHPYVRDMYEDKKTCPEEIMLYFHRLPYNYRLKSGQTLIQYIYDTHFEGVDDVKGFIQTWESIKEHMPIDAYTPVRQRLDAQLKNAEEWRDVVNSYFYRKTGIADEKGRKIY
ncbi:MAG: alpha-glucuronidase [Defluviitaleaceae bacterium]|nr:alpha-glucuronidase [Defluviitaleaceae bacterium]